MPVGEAVDAAEALDELLARAQHQVVGVAQNDVGAELLQVGRCHGSDRGPSAHRHENRRG